MTAVLKPWADGPWLAFDLETTGVQVFSDRIVTATVLHIEAPDPATRRSHIDAHSWLVDPGVDIPAEATAVHGITTEYAREHGQDRDTATREIAETIGKHWGPDLPLVAMNAAFDLSMLDAHLRELTGTGLTVAGPVLDPYVLDKAVDPYRKGKRRLADLCALYEVQLDHAHDSHDDAIAATRLVWRLARRYPEIGSLHLDALHDRQVEWADRQAQSLQDYLRRTKRKDGATPDEIAAVVVDRGWPLRSTP